MFCAKEIELNGF